ncbi:unnamed protein product [Owenia fusiformis]|uniref:Uncharacterized protein n=1 Tax=Owenia fusiformis TaxID=6347 RepID=A0A8J1Y1M1_OWEFU|nr:unnamed protein product [Owenia fusiformis]
MIKLTAIVLFLLYGHCALANAARPDPTDQYDYNAALSTKDTYHIYWNYTNETITFEVHANTLGYVGFGFSPNGGMKRSDMIIGWVGADGTVYFKDRHTNDSLTTPTIDEKQDYYLDYGLEKDGWTVLKFWRLLDTCDDLDWPIDDGTVKVIWSYHPDDPSSDTDLLYHGQNRRGSKSIQLITHRGKSAPVLPDDVESLQFCLTNVSVPSRRTTYWCQGFLVPTFEKKQHVVAFKEIVQPGNEGLVHHIILYACHHEINESHHGYASKCFNPNMPDNMVLCTSIVFGWAVGAGMFALPPHAGMPIGPGSNFNFVLMEVHWDNPQSIQGLYDTSGLELIYTPTLRQYDATMLETGIISGHSFQVNPPHTPAFINPGTCTSECLTAAMAASNANDGIKLIGVQLHAHLAATGILVRHFRKGVELPEIQRDNNYDFNFQETRHLPQEVTVLPGDELRVECRYDTTSKDTVTWGGLGTLEEMCIAYIMYYPRINMTTCQTVSRTSELLSIAGVTETTESEDDYRYFDVRVVEPEKWTGRHFKDILRTEVDWTNATVRERFQDITYNAGRLALCRQSLAHVYYPDSKFLPPQNITKTLEKKPRVCLDPTFTTTQNAVTLSPSTESVGGMGTMAQASIPLVFLVAITFSHTYS